MNTRTGPRQIPGIYICKMYERDYGGKSYIFADVEIDGERRTIHAEDKEGVDIIALIESYAMASATKKAYDVQTEIADQSPPSWSSTIAAMTVSRDMRETYLGCRREQFEGCVQSLGHGKANWLYRWDTLCDVVRAIMRSMSPSALLNMGSALLRYWS